MAAKTLRKIQLGAETTKGTIAAATTVWRGTGTIEDTIDVKHADEDVGYMMGVDRTYISKKEGKITLEQEATFEQLPYVFEAGIKTVAGDQDGTGSGYAYIYPLPTTAAQAIKTYTIEGGDDAGAEVVDYCFVTAFKLSGKGGEAVTVSADWVGQEVVPQAFTGAVALPTVYTIIFSKGYLYIDAIGSTAGTTLKSNTLLGFDLDYKTGFNPVYTASGSLSFGFDKQTQPSAELKITFEHDATSVAEKVIWRAETARKLRLKFEGAELSTASDYTYKTLIIDLCGKWSKFDKIGEQNGNDIVTGTFIGKYDVTAASAGQIVVVNELSALT